MIYRSLVFTLLILTVLTITLAAVQGQIQDEPKVQKGLTVRNVEIDPLQSDEPDPRIAIPPDDRKADERKRNDSIEPLAPAVPGQINYQGYLTDNAGHSINNSVAMTFGIYDAASGGSMLWSEAQTVNVEDGLFSIVLGSVGTIPVSVFTYGTERYLELQVNSQVLLPRTKLTGIGYSFNSAFADSAYRLTDNTVTTGKIVNGTILPEDLSVPPATRPLDPPVTTSEIGDDQVGAANLAHNIDASGIGFNADLLDGSHASVFALSTHEHWNALWDGYGFGLSLRSYNDMALEAVGGPSYVTAKIYTDTYTPSFGSGDALTVNGLAYGTRSEGGTVGVYGKVRSGGMYGVWGASYGGQYGVYYTGGLGGTGAKSTAVGTSTGPRLLYSQESPENWFEDFGETQLVNGRVHVDLDPLFLETVTIDNQNPMKVFVQLNDDCNGTYVERGQTGFDIVELNQGRSNAHLTYRILAKRRGFEDKRLDYCSTALNDPYLNP